MSIRARVFGTVIAVLLAGSIVPTASAAPSPPSAGTMIIACPAAAQVATALGSSVTVGRDGSQECGYSVNGGGDVYFAFTDSTLPELRSEATATGAKVVTIPGLGADAFGYAEGGAWHMRHPAGGSVAVLDLPMVPQTTAITVAELFVAATAPWPDPTVAPLPITLSCPTGEQVADIVGGAATLTSAAAHRCSYSHADSTITFSVDQHFGSVAELRTDVELRLSGYAVVIPVDTQNFTGLGPGAFAWADASPTFLYWQMCPGVVAQLYSWADHTQLRDLAVLLNQRTPCPGATPTGTLTPGGTPPGLPSTGY